MPRLRHCFKIAEPIFLSILIGNCLFLGLFSVKSDHNINYYRNDSDLVSIFVLSRHGDRSPLKSFPKDKYFSVDYWPMGRGQITKTGVMRMYKLGQWLRKRYDGFINDMYIRDELYAYSTDTDRTLMSANAILAGLYPPKDYQVWNENLQWQPIPVHTVDRQHDEIFTMKRHCHKHSIEYNEAKKKTHKAMKEQHEDLFNYIGQHSGWKNLSLKEVKTLCSNIYTYKAQGFNHYIPKWAVHLDLDLLDYLAATEYQLNSCTPLLKRLQNGPFFAYLFKHFDKWVDGSKKNRPKVVLIAGHDTSMAPILDAMGVFNMRPVHFGDTIIWELRQAVDGRYFINLLYRRNNDLERMKILNREYDCKYADVKAALKNVTVDIDQWTEECNSF